MREKAQYLQDAYYLHLAAERAKQLVSLFVLAERYYKLSMREKAQYLQNAYNLQLAAERAKQLVSLFVLDRRVLETKHVREGPVSARFL